jgi:hypothetical protein
MKCEELVQPLVWSMVLAGCSSLYTFRGNHAARAVIPGPPRNSNKTSMFFEASFFQNYEMFVSFSVNVTEK